MEKILGIVKDPERFLMSRYYGLGVPKGFRIELFVARKFRLIFDNLKLPGHNYPKMKDNWLGRDKVVSVVPVKKLREIVSNKPFTKHPEKVFCPYCEKSVIPKRHHKLDFGDLVLVVFTAGLWAIFLFVMHLFVRRCPVCNYNLRGFKPLSEKKPKGN